MTMFDKFELNEQGPDSGTGTADGVGGDHHAADAAATAEAARPAPAIPPELERAAADAGASIRSRFQVALSRPKAPEIAARVFLRGLRGPRKKAGRKPYPNTTEALRLLEGRELEHIPKSKRWAIIYRRVIPGYGGMPPEQAAGAAAVLQGRVYSRIRMRRRRKQERRARALMGSESGD
jgi:hypothetical protein